LLKIDDDRPVTLPDHVQGDVEDDDQAEEAQPSVALEKAGDPGGGKAHEGDGQQQAHHQDPDVLAGRAGHRQDVVQGHGHVRQQDLRHGLAHGLGTRRRGGLTLELDACGFLEGLCRLGGLGLMPLPELAPHLPAHPEQEDAAGEEKADQLQELDGHYGQTQAQGDGGHETVKDGFAPLFGRQTCGGEADGHGVVSGEGQVDHDDLSKSDQGFGGGEGDIQHDLFWRGAGQSATSPRLRRVGGVGKVRKSQGRTPP